jgi:hypothetical protein
MKLALVTTLLACLSTVYVPMSASPSDGIEQNVQRLYESARARRIGVWTKDIWSMDGLRTAYFCYLKFQNHSVALAQRYSEFALLQLQVPDLPKMAPKNTNPSDVGMLWRNRLVAFAGEDAVNALEHASVMELDVDLNPSFPGKSRPDLPDYIEMPPSQHSLPGLIDVPSGRQIYVPDEGLRRSPI